VTRERFQIEHNGNNYVFTATKLNDERSVEICLDYVKTKDTALLESLVVPHQVVVAAIRRIFHPGNNDEC
jgi:hypothetical protein